MVITVWIRVMNMIPSYCRVFNIIRFRCSVMWFQMSRIQRWMLQEKSCPFLLRPSNLPAWTKQEVRVCVVHMTEEYLQRQSWLLLNICLPSIPSRIFPQDFSLHRAIASFHLASFHLCPHFLCSCLHARLYDHVPFIIFRLFSVNTCPCFTPGPCPGLALYK